MPAVARTPARKPEPRTSSPLPSVSTNVELPESPKRCSALTEGFNVPYLESLGLPEDVLSVMKHGWKMEMLGEDLPVDWSTRHNKSAIQHWDAFSREVVRGVREGYLRPIAKHEVKTLNPITMIVKEDSTKPNGFKERLCIDVSRNVNLRIPLHGFRMVNIPPHFKAFRKGIWMAKLDIKDGYHHIRIVPEQQGHLSFQAPDGEYYCYARMPFGLNMAPYVFQRIINEVLAPLQDRHFVLCESYLDDIWLQADTASALRKAISYVVAHLETIGFVINKAKSLLEPVQVMEYLGVVFDSRTGCLRVAPKHKEKALKRIVALRREPHLQAWQQCVGLLVFLTNVIPEGKAHLPALYANFSAKRSNPRVVSRSSKYALAWWRSALCRDTSRPCLTSVDYVYESDASEIGGGLNCVYPLRRRDQIAIEWDRSHEHSNIRELDAVRHLLVLRGDVLGNRHRSNPRSRDLRTHVHVRMDNTSSISTVNKGGSSSATLNGVRKLIWELQRRHSIHLSASYIRGVDNVVADSLSRRKESPVTPAHTGVNTVSSGFKASAYVPLDVESANPRDPRTLIDLARQGIGAIPATSVGRAKAKFSSGYHVEQRVTGSNPQYTSVRNPSYLRRFLAKTRADDVPPRHQRSGIPIVPVNVRLTSMTSGPDNHEGIKPLTSSQ